MPYAWADSRPATPLSLSESLRLMLPALPEQLVGAEAMPWLTKIAAALPPIHRAGFECRLAEGSPIVDLQQGVLGANGEPARLAALLAAQEPLNDPWSRVQALARRWSDRDDALSRGIAEVWLELDAEPSAASEALQLRDVAPSVFAVLGPADAKQSLALARAVIATLVTSDEADSLGEAVAWIAAACPPPARVSHVGVMLGRSVAALRVHVTPVALSEIADFLRRVGWPADPQSVQALMAALLDHGDYVVVCLDVVGRQVVRLGLECFFVQAHGVDPRWRPLLDRLVGRGLSTTDKAAALLRWPGLLTPLDRPEAWPEGLIAESLTRPAPEFGVLDRRLSHVKLTCSADLEVSAKAYFGFGPVWTQTDPPRAPLRTKTTRTATSGSGAVEAALTWLLGKRNQAGLWRDFFDRARPADVAHRVAGYASDEWVTAFVAAALAESELSGARGAAHEALALLLRRRTGTAGWGYHALLPADADTTIWVLRLARALGVPEDRQLANGAQLVQSLTRGDGGICTYPKEATGQLAAFLKMDGSYAGWCAEHACVTAAAAALDLGLDPGPVAYLRAHQRADGSWAGHWWDDDEYTTARAVEALAGRPADRGRVELAGAWAAGRIQDSGAVSSPAHGGPSAFATALALHTIRRAGPDLRANHAQAAERAERWLLEHQLDDGSWDPSARLRVPAPAALDATAAPELTLTYVDDEGLFTTATVVSALSARAAPRS